MREPPGVIRGGSAEHGEALVRVHAAKQKHHAAPARSRK
jgi:hypothetical protein